MQQALLATLPRLPCSIDPKMVLRDVSLAGKRLVVWLTGLHPVDRPDVPVIGYSLDWPDGRSEGTVALRWIHDRSAHTDDSFHMVLKFILFRLTRHYPREVPFYRHNVRPEDLPTFRASTSMSLFESRPDSPAPRSPKNPGSDSSAPSQVLLF